MTVEKGRWTWLAAAGALLVLLTACGQSPADVAPGTGLAGSPKAEPAAEPPVDRDRPRIVALGDSLTAGYGLPADQSYPAVLQHLLEQSGYDYEIVNLGVSGDTSAGGLRRLDWALDGDVRVVIVALGGNDGLRGLPPAELERNLSAIVGRVHEQGARVLLCGMEAPPNLGASYTREFRAVYRRLAERDAVTFLPFLLDGIAGVPSLNQGDGIHPNPEGARRMASLVWARLEPLLERAGTS